MKLLPFIYMRTSTYNRKCRKEDKMSEKAFTFTPENGNACQIVDTFAEMFPMWASRVLITADNEKWALTAASAATGLATSVVMSPAEAGIEGIVSPNETPDSRIGVVIQVYNRNRFELKKTK